MERKFEKLVLGFAGITLLTEVLFLLICLWYYYNISTPFPGERISIEVVIFFSLGAFLILAANLMRYVKKEIPERKIFTFNLLFFIFFSWMFFMGALENTNKLDNQITDKLVLLFLILSVITMTIREIRIRKGVIV